jgi:hypothetical protein
MPPTGKKGSERRIEWEIERGPAIDLAEYL